MAQAAATRQQDQPSVPKAAAAAPGGQAPKQSLYVGDLDRGVDEGLLYNIFSKVECPQHLAA